MRYRREISVASFNCQGLNDIGKRQELKAWGKEAKADIICIQETGVMQQCVEKGDHYDIYFASDSANHTKVPKGRGKGRGKGKGRGREGQATYLREYAGVGFLVKKSIASAITRVEQYSSRVIRLTINATPPIDIICAYAPQAGSPADPQEVRERRSKDKEQFYSDLQRAGENTSNSGPTIYAGDFNARLHAQLPGEEGYIGKHIYGRGAIYLRGTNTSTKENREHFINWLMENDLFVANTRFSKPKEKLITYREPKAGEGTSVEQADCFNQVDFIVTPNRWKNAITDVSSAMDAALPSDHYPLIAKVCTRLATRSVKKGRVYRNLADPDASEEFTRQLEATAVGMEENGKQINWKDYAE